MMELSANYRKSSQLMSACRTCLKDLSLAKKTSVFDHINQDAHRLRIWDIILLCASNIVALESDDCSKSVCGECLVKLQHFYEFRRKIEESDRILRSFQLNEVPAYLGTVSENFQQKEQNDEFGTEINALDTNNIAEADAIKLIKESGGVEIEETVCVLCRKTFSSHGRLQLHMVRKHSVRSDQNVGKEYTCDKCEKSYTTRANLLIHEQSHLGSKSFVCHECGRAFYRESALMNHSSIHTGLKQFKCDECDKCFTTANILQQHRKTHLPMRPHKCTMCSRAFYRQYDLNVHFRMHTREQPYLCCQCGKRFSRKTHLNIHLRTHTGVKPFNCQYCEKSFGLSGDLTAHIRIHTGEKPYECSVCQKTFNQSSARNIHMRVHTGKRNYICPVCSAAFTQSASLKRHMKSHIVSDLIGNSDA